MEDYRSNSHKAKAEAKEAAEKKVDKVVTGNVKRKKKSEVSKFKDVFISEDVSNVKSYIFLDVLVPAIKKAVSDIVKDGVDMMLYGDKRSGSRGSSSYASGKAYDVSDMRNAVYSFAAQSTNQADYCLRLVSKMKFKSEEPAVALTNDEKPLVFYDCEVFPNLFLVNWKVQGEGKPIVRLINPRPQDIEELIKFRLVGFNCRRYDNHMLYACMMGYTNEQLYDLSQKIVNTKKGDSRKVLFGEAYNISYTDIYDFASAGNKKSLKKLEIEMGIHHQELGLPWDKPVPKELWQKVAEYCDNDVLATEAAWDYLKSDFIAREILADLAGLTVNDTTNTLTQRFIFGNNKHPQNEFQYRNLAEPVYELDPEVKAFLEKSCREMMAEPHGEACSLLPYFPGYKYAPGGGVLVREQNGKFYAATGTTGFRWLEAEMLLKKSAEMVTIIDPDTGKEKEISGAELISGNDGIVDRSYYDKLVNDAIESISKHGDYEWFISEDPYIPKEKPLPDFMNIPEGTDEEVELPWN